MGDNGEPKTMDEYDLRHFFQLAPKIALRKATRNERFK